MALLYKASYKHIRKSLTFAGVGESTTIEVASFPGGEGRTQAKAAQKILDEEIQHIVGKHIANMCVATVPEALDVTAASVLGQVKGMSAETFATFVLGARLKKTNNEPLSSLEQTLCDIQVETRVKELRKLSGRVTITVVYISQVKETGQVQPEIAFKATWRQLAVTIHNQSLLTIDMPRLSSGKVTLETLMNFPQLHQTVTLLIPGKSRTGSVSLTRSSA